MFHLILTNIFWWRTTLYYWPWSIYDFYNVWGTSVVAQAEIPRDEIHNFFVQIMPLVSKLTRGLHINIELYTSAHALGGVSGVASFITTDERLQ